MRHKRLYMVFLLSVLTCVVHAEGHDIHAEADRPGMGTGANVLPWGCIQWESGFEGSHLWDTHFITLPTTLFRFGLGPRAELRLEYTGELELKDRSVTVPEGMAAKRYQMDPLDIGTKIRLWAGSDEERLRWIPRTSMMLNIGVPLTRSMAKQVPFSGKIDLLFENDVTNWLTLGYDVGAYWTDWSPTPDVFVSLAFNFMPTDKLGVFIESYNFFDPDGVDIATSKYYTHSDICLDFGLTYMVHPHVQLDAYAGFNLYNSEPKLSTPRNNVAVGFGVTWLLYTGPQK